MVIYIINNFIVEKIPDFIGELDSKFNPLANFNKYSEMKKVPSD